MKFSLKHLVVVLGIASAPAAYSSELLYSQPWDGTGQGYLSTPADTAVVDSFAVDPNGSDHIKVDHIGWAGSYTPGFGPVNFGTDFDVAIYDSSSNLVADRIGTATYSSLGNGSLSGSENFWYSLDISSDKFALYSGLYWISIQALSQTGDIAWYWSTSLTGRNDSVIYAAGTSWDPAASSTHNFAFDLKGTVPEPATLLLMVPALIGLGFSRKGQKA
jgi:hypothetical protein